MFTKSERGVWAGECGLVGKEVGRHGVYKQEKGDVQGPHMSSMSEEHIRRVHHPDDDLPSQISAASPARVITAFTWALRMTNTSMFSRFVSSTIPLPYDVDRAWIDALLCRLQTIADAFKDTMGRRCCPPIAQ